MPYLWCVYVYNWWRHVATFLLGTDDLISMSLSALIVYFGYKKIKKTAIKHEIFNHNLTESVISGLLCQPTGLA